MGWWSCAKRKELVLGLAYYPHKLLAWNYDEINA